ncbi:MAG: anthranilate phosphoribosyltransferase [Balneolaceae bacterium]
MQQSFTHILEILINDEDLSSEQASIAMNLILSGSVSGEEISAFLMALRIKGESITELTAFVKEMRRVSVHVDVDTKDAVDLCGTGGDKSGTFNISTASMFVTAGAGIPVLKHGNRSVSSKSGSYDVLKELGAVPNLQKKEVEMLFNETGMAFMFAPNFHPALKHVMPARRALKIRTLFNMLGPLLNPAAVKHQLVGTFSMEAAQKMIRIFDHLDVENAITVYAQDGLDEVSLTSKSNIFESKSGKSNNAYSFDPTSLGYEMVHINEIMGGDAKQNAEIIRAIVENRSTKAQRDVVELNAAFAIYSTGSVDSLKQAKDQAKMSIDSGEAKKKLDQFIKESQKVAEDH